MKKLALAACFAVFLSACATGYGPVYERASGPYDEGYFDRRLDENHYLVHYRSGYADPRLAQDFAIRRAAELTLQQDYEWFQIISRNSSFEDRVFDRYESMQYYRDEYPAPPRYDRRYDDDDALAAIEILMGYDPPPRSANIYDARRVLAYARDHRRYDDYDRPYDRYDEDYPRRRY